MQDSSKLLVEYFRRCYQADNHDLSLGNVAKLANNRRMFLSDRDFLSSEELPRIPLVSTSVAQLSEQAEAYRKERSLIYAVFFISGLLPAQVGFISKRKLCAPLLYFPAQVYCEEEYFAEIHSADLRINLPVLRLILKVDVDPSVTDTFPVPSFPLDSAQVAAMGRWLEENTQLEGIGEIGRWPNLHSSPHEEWASRSALRVISACAVLLADRSRGSRGVIHELRQLSQAQAYSVPLTAVLGERSGDYLKSDSEPEMLPGLLSAAQERALHNAANLPLSLISGPPGTGKSFTIAAMAIDQMLHGGTVLVVSKTPQAIDVVRQKLRDTYGLSEGYVHAGERGFVRSLKAHLDSLLKEGIAPPEIGTVKLKSNLKTTLKSLRRAERRFEWALRIAQAIGVGGGWLSALSARVLRRRLDTEALWAFQDTIGHLRNCFERQSAGYINTYRKETLLRLLDKERQHLTHFHQALRARTSKTQAERFARTNMKAVLQAYPIWLASLDELNEILPLSRELFDLVIFDESTQCDIASALPALYRAKRAVVVGDGKQLRHVSFLSAQAQQRLWSEINASGELPASLSYRDQSLLDIVSDSLRSQEAVTLLDEHYRSQPELIAFSNHAFYADRLKVMQARPGASDEGALTLHNLEGRRAKNGRNRVEKDWVIERLREHMDRYVDSPVKPTVGVLSPYREQADYLAVELGKAFSAKKLSSFSVRVATPYGFQGDERDVMLLSLAVDSQSLRAATYLNRADMFNVAVTRAKERQLVAYSVNPDSLPNEHLLRRYLTFSLGAGSKTSQKAFPCEFAREVSAGLKQAHIRHWIAFPIAGQRIDVVCEYRGHILGVDLIGYPGEYRQHFTIQTYKVLYRAGVKVLPLPYVSWSQDRRDCLRRILEVLKQE
ncbi:ATP-binding protein [uncultured Microbulbifer sp.]|uniref:DEAD/DEAH box helicase n=1 Tax=uncultured Microbulbifer sp. TaxID=348147 RepID=UPI00260B774F|nr:ATP-binding protein [uncultured Microbulbifer sp.]